MVAGNANYDTSLLTMTLETYMRTQPADAIFEDNAIWEILNNRGKVTKKGGYVILEPLMYGQNTAVGSFSGYDTLDVSPQEGFTNAQFDWKQYYGTISISERESEINSGKSAVIDLLDSKWTQLRMSLRDLLNSHFFTDGTGNNSKNVTGLVLGIDSTGTYGNIVRSANSWWGAQETAVSGVLTVDGSTGMRRMFNDCSVGRAKRTPDALIGTQIIYEAYEALMDPYMRYTVTGEGNAVFKQDNLMFRNAKMFWDADCTSQVLYFLNSEFMRLVMMDGQDFKVHGFQEPINQAAKVAKITWMGNLVINNCRHLGKLTGITNS